MNDILDCIIDEAKIFLNNNMSLNIVEIKATKNNTLDTHISLIDLTGNEKFRVIISIEDRLFEILFHKFFKDGVEDSEKDELIDALPDEIINIIVGLAIRHFPLKYEDLVLGIPIKSSKENISNGIEIITSEGSLICTIMNDI